MDSVGVLIVFAILGSLICARARTALGAVVFAVIAVVLFIGTPGGASLPGAIASFVATLNHATTPVLTHQNGGGVG